MTNLSSISKISKSGSGSSVVKDVSIKPMVSIGNFCLVNAESIIKHKCKINNTDKIAPSENLAYCLSVGKNYLKKKGIQIFKNGSLNTSVPVLLINKKNSTLIGNPAKKNIR